MAKLPEHCSGKLSQLLNALALGAHRRIPRRPRRAPRPPQRRSGGRRQCARLRAVRCPPGARSWWNPCVASAQKRGGCVAACSGGCGRCVAPGVWCACPLMGSNAGAMGGRRGRSHPENEPPHGTAMALWRTSDLGMDSCVGSLDDVHGPVEHERPASSRLQGPWVFMLGQPPS